MKIDYRLGTITPDEAARRIQQSEGDVRFIATETGESKIRVLEMLQIAKQRGLSIDDVIASMQEAGR